MYLRDVMVLPAEFDRDATGRLRQSCDHVLDILRHHLPKKYSFNDLRRLVVYLGPDKQGARPPFRNGGDNVGEYLAADFDLTAYFNAPQDIQETTLLDCVESALLDLSAKFGTDPEPLRTAAQHVRDAGFRLGTELSCSRSHPSRKLRVRVVRQFAPGGCFVIAKVTAAKGEVLRTDTLAEGMWVVTVGHTYRTSRWSQDTLELLDGSGRKVAEVVCGQYLTANEAI